MFSTHESESLKYGEGEDDPESNRGTSQGTARSEEAVDQPPAEKQEGQAEKTRDDEHSSPPHSPRDDVESQHQRPTAQEKIPSRFASQTEGRHQQASGEPSTLLSSAGASFGSEGRNEATRSMPWWGGAFGAIPDMRDSPEARGFYARRFCEIFFPDNIPGATEVSQGKISTRQTSIGIRCTTMFGEVGVRLMSTLEVEEKQSKGAYGHLTLYFNLSLFLAMVGELHSCQVLCTLLDGDTPAETIAPPGRSANLDTTLDELGMEHQQDGDGTKGDGAQAKTEPSSTPPSAKYLGKGGNAVGVDGRDGGSGSVAAKEGRADEKPEKSRFNILLGMLTIATMVDAEGEAASSWAAKSSGGIEQNEHENGDRTKSGRIRQPRFLRFRAQYCITALFPLEISVRALRPHCRFGARME